MAVVRGAAPHFETVAVVGNAFARVSLADLVGKYVVLVFYPLDFTFVCPTELCQFADRLDEFEALNCEVLACSVDSQFTHLAWNEKARRDGGLGGARLPLLADVSKSISRSYGVLCEEEGVAFRGTVVIDGRSTVRHWSVNDLPVGRSVDEVACSCTGSAQWCVHSCSGRTDFPWTGASSRPSVPVHG